MNLRLQAAGVLSKVVNDGQSLTVALDNAMESIAEPKDKAFVQALCYGVIRHYYQLDFILQQLLSKPLRKKDSDIQMLLLLGLYQLQYMRVKAHAAVSETVSAAKRKSWAKSLVNGVLRRYQREQEELLQSTSTDAVAAAMHPQWLLDKINQDWPEQAKQLISENNQPPPMALRVNLQLSDRQSYLQLLAEQGIEARPLAVTPSAIVLEQAVAVEKLPGFKQGKVSVQDTAAQLAATLLEVQPGDTVLDLCAAPGGKTAAILELQPKLAAMTAVDIDQQRLQRVKQNLKRLNLKAEVVQADAIQVEQCLAPRQFERILLDVPCSALGVIRRHPDIKLLRRESDIAALQAVQQQILQASWALLKPGGMLLYATCSVLKQENEQQIAEFLANHPNAEERPIDADWGHKRPFGRQILTGDQGMDGFYYARLIKR